MPTSVRVNMLINLRLKNDTIEWLMRPANWNATVGQYSQQFSVRIALILIRRILSIEEIYNIRNMFWRNHLWLPIVFCTLIVNKECQVQCIISNVQHSQHTLHIHAWLRLPTNKEALLRSIKNIFEQSKQLVSNRDRISAW